MTPEFWHARWQNGELGWHLEEINGHLRTFWPTLGLPADTLVFVPLCGKTLDLLWLTSQKQRVIGIEISEIAVRDFFAEHGLTPEVTKFGALERWQAGELTILRGDFFDLTATDLTEVGAVYDCASLIALPKDLRARYAEHLKSIVPSKALCLLITFAYDQEKMSGPPFAVLSDEIAALYADRYRIEDLATFDAINDLPTLRDRGLSTLSKTIWHLQPLTSNQAIAGEKQTN
ncbi:MAG TPA: thiopurine S-methyltransferase [Chromatiaceae bacterium]|nr:MAG: thiopurine S-methyltransferase [Thiohalocapsa sp. PB-PSB1]HBG93834.1 thiopurine S-methyltransferase [Chromatiaceae bacterium]HCS88555.1 thiopurine S-methyltransferase [Chromatiaceae bacterium]